MYELSYKKIEREDEDQLWKLVSGVLAATPLEFFIPYEEWELKSFFDETYALLHGAYSGDKLVGISQMFVRQEMLQEYKRELGLVGENVCELGGNLVLKEHRGRGIQYSLMSMQYELGKEMGFNYLITMAHPENLASIKSIRKLGFKLMKQTRLNNGFLRNIYCSERLS